MSSAAQSTVKGWVLATVFSLVTGLILVASVIPVFAVSPHIRSTVDTARCSACHSVHAATGPLLLRAEPIADDVSNVCLRCHDGSDGAASNVVSGSVDSFGMPSGHSLTSSGPGNVEVNGCATCHDAHGAAEDARMIPAARINGVAVSSAGSEMCLACHASNDDWYGPDYPSSAQPTRDDAGYPVSGTWTGASTYFSAGNAHRLIPDTTQTVGVSEPVRREAGDCGYCHSAHGGPNVYDGLVATYTVPAQSQSASAPVDSSYAALCFECHGGQTPSGFATATVDIERFAAGSVGAGHSIVTSGGTLPVGAPVPCFECHNAHGSKRGNGSLITDERGASLATTSSAGVRAFCFTCHTTSNTTTGWDSSAETYTVAAAQGDIVGLPRDGGVLRLPDAEGHVQSDARSCYECHGNSYVPGGSNVHDPGSGAEPITAPQVALRAMPSSLSSGTVEATGSVVATGSLEATVSLDATGSLDATASAEATPSILGTEPAWPPFFPVWPAESGVLLGSTGATLLNRRRR